MGTFGISWRLAVAFLAGTAFFAPVVATFAASAPMTAESVIPTPRFVGIRVHPFETFEGGSCFPSSPSPTLHLGPVEFFGNRQTVAWVDSQVRGATQLCHPGWKGGFTVEVAVDQDGRVERTTFDGDADPWLTRCVGSLVRQNLDPEDRPAPGAATVRAGYLMRMTRDM